MKEESRRYAEAAYDIIKHASEKIGSRLPGTDSEKKFAEYMGDKLREIGIEPVTEEFRVSPRASIGGIPYAGWFGVALSALTYVALKIPTLWIGMGFCSIAMLVWLVFSVFLYKRWFDMFFNQEISQNTYGELLPPDGKYDYTIVLSGHTDTSWNWVHSENTYKHRDNPVKGLISTFSKVGFGGVCVIGLSLISILMGIVNAGAFLAPGSIFGDFINCPDGKYALLCKILMFLPPIVAIGSVAVILWADPNPRDASRGAMDNASGCALAYMVTRYYKENPDKMPKNCRIIDFNCGSEEAGLRGSMAFTDLHKGEPILENCWNINIDSVADKDYFEVVIKDDWQFTRFDTDLEKMFKDTFKELGVESKTNGCIHNPVGGCDSTPLTKAGVKSVTFAAQNPTLTYYYHTWRDTADRFDAETIGTGFDVITGVIDKIAAFQEKNGFNGPQKK